MCCGEWERRSARGPKRGSLAPLITTLCDMALAAYDAQDTSDAESDTQPLEQAIEERGESPEVGVGGVDTPDRDDSEVIQFICVQSSGETLIYTYLKAERDRRRPANALKRPHSSTPRSPAISRA